jgi:hypothetical protein
VHDEIAEAPRKALLPGIAEMTPVAKEDLLFAWRAPLRA